MARVANRKSGKPKKSPKKAGARQKRSAPKLGSALDAAALAHARMLADPCNATMGPPCYSGMGTGEYRRFRRILNIPAAVEGTYSFVPGANAFVAGTHTINNSGQPYTFESFPIFPTDQLVAVESRCIAACIKVRYTGTESERKGVVGMKSNPFVSSLGGTVSTAAEELTMCPLINRVGEVQHEVKFVPGTGDELFTGNFGGAIASYNTLGSVGFTFADIPTLTLQVEITAIIELEPKTAMVVNSVPTPSRNTLNNVLAALGPPTRWAYGHVVAPTVRAMAGAAMQTISSGLNARSVGGMLLTL